MQIDNIDNGKSFDWGNTSEDYARYRDIYPKEFYDYILNLGLCKDGQRVLDVGTGTGVLPRNMYEYGAKWTGTDISENQIKQAKILAAEKEMDIDFYACPAEEISYEDNTFDVITICQCIWYLNASAVSGRFAKMLKKDGKILVLYMGWLPYEDRIAGKSEEIILKYNPNWSAYGDHVQPVFVPDDFNQYFDIIKRDEFRVDIPFTRDGWHGRMRASRGVSASMDENALNAWNEEHWKMLCLEAPEKFYVKHYVSIAELGLSV